jgi:hypothetical protein
MSALVIISESELQGVIKTWDYSYPEKYPDFFNKILHGLGGNINKKIEIQDNPPFLHRNRLNKVAYCRRWVLFERLDSEWIESRYSSREARNAASNSKLVQDLNPLNYLRF